MSNISDRLDNLFEKISEVREQNARIEEKLNAFALGVTQNSQDISHMKEDIAKTKGAALALSAIFGSISGVLVTVVRGMMKS